MTNPATEFKVGNSLWRERTTHGRPPVFEPDELWDACTEYFDFIDENPVMTVELVKYQGLASKVEVPKMRAMTLDHLYNFLDISPQTWANYREKSDYMEIIGKVERIIRTQKFQGAAADLLNANIIARDLGL